MAVCSQSNILHRQKQNTKFPGLNILLYGKASSMFASNNWFIILQFQTIIKKTTQQLHRKCYNFMLS